MHCLSLKILLLEGNLEVVEEKMDLEVDVPSGDIFRRLRVVVLRVGVKIGSIKRTTHIRDNGRSKASIAKSVPVKSVEPPVNRIKID